MKITMPNDISHAFRQGAVMCGENPYEMNTREWVAWELGRASAHATKRASAKRQTTEDETRATEQE